MTRFLCFFLFSEVLEAIKNDWEKDNVLLMTPPASCAGSFRDTDFAFTHSRVDFYFYAGASESHTCCKFIQQTHCSTELNISRIVS